MKNALRNVVFLLLVLHAITGFSTFLDKPYVKWKFKTQGTIRGSGAFFDNTVYFGSADGYLYAVSKEDGTLNWKYKTEGSIASSPAVSESAVFISSRDNFIYAIDRATGTLKWKFKTQPRLEGYTEWEYFMSSPVISDSKLVVGSADGHVYALDVENGQELWKFKTGDRVRATPLVLDGMIYQPGNDGVVYALTLAEGSLKKKFITEGASLDRNFGFDRTNIFTKPVIRNGLLIIGSRDGKAYAFEAATGKKIWDFKYGTTWAMSVNADMDAAYIGWSTNNMFCAIELNTGIKKWDFQTGSMNFSTALVLEEDVVFGSADGNLYSLKKKNGKQNWTYEVGREVYSSPVSDGHTIYFGADDGYFYALKAKEQPKLAVYAMEPPYAHASFLVNDPSIEPYLKDRGFHTLDSLSLSSFFQKRIKDQKPSVVVFAYALMPANVLGADPSKGLVRQYLESGGKIIWLQGIPNIYTPKPDGSFKVDPGLAEKLLDVKFARTEESGNYYCKTTQAGLNMGMPVWLKNSYISVADEGIVPLAYDEMGRVGPWMKKFNSKPESGFISCRSWGYNVAMKEADLKLIYDLAVYGMK